MVRTFPILIPKYAGGILARSLRNQEREKSGGSS